MDKFELEWYTFQHGNIWKLIYLFGVSRNTIIKYINVYNIEQPKGFFSKGKKVGRPKGFRHTEEWKDEHRQRMLGNNNPFYGEHHSDKSIQKMSGPRESITGENNPFKKSLEDETKHQEHINRCNDIWDGRDEEWRKKFGRKVSKSLANSSFLKDKRYHKHHISGNLQTSKAGKIFYRSSWERDVAIQLDMCRLVDSFSLEEFVIEYINENGDLRYSKIDFMITTIKGNKAMFEVKPKSLQQYKNNKYKIKGYRKYCNDRGYDFRLIDEDNRHNIFEVIHAITFN